MQQMSNSGWIGATRCQRLLNRLPQPIMAMLPGKHQHLDHLPGAALLAMPFHQRLPDLIETRRPEASPALLLQRSRSRQCARLALGNDPGQAVEDSVCNYTTIFMLA